MLTNFDQFASATNEVRFWDWLTGSTEESSTMNVSDMYSEFQQFITSGKPMILDTNSEPKYSKLIKFIQIALLFLGYKLPKYGADGMFGDETIDAINKFNANTAGEVDEQLIGFSDFSKILDESANGMLGPNELVNVDSPGNTNTNGKLNPEAAKAYKAMKSAAEKDGVFWSITDSYRDYNSQLSVARKKGLYKYGGLAAVPGTSNHGWGAALDLKLDNIAQQWLKTNASKYGFSTIPKEPWHWVHKASADKLKRSQSTSFNKVIIDSNFVGRLFTNLKRKNFSDSDIAKYVNKQTIAEIPPEDEQFYKSLLNMLGTKETPEKLKFLKAWRQAEGGEALYNPFNTTMRLKVSGITNYANNKHGVKNYPDLETGLKATVDTLKLSHYANLVNLLMDDNVTAEQLAKSEDLNTWGTKDGVEKVLAGGTIAPPPIATKS